MFSNMAIADSLMSLWYERAQAYWTPSEISTTAWYDADDTSTITFGVGTKVSQWSDKSGNNKHITQGVANNQPAYISSDPMLGGRPSIYALSDGIYTRGLNQSAATSVKRVYFVCYMGNGTELIWGNHKCVFSSTDSLVRLTGRAGAAPDGTRVFDGSRASQNFDYFTGTYTSPNLPTTFRNGSTTSTIYQLNGLPIPATIFVVESTTTHTKTWRLLNNGANFSVFGGGISEFIMTDGSEDLTTQKKIEGYFAWKWGLVNLLPTDHPYKNSAPLK